MGDSEAFYILYSKQVTPTRLVPNHVPIQIIAAQSQTHLVN